jgi:hypothetical protein
VKCCQVSEMIQDATVGWACSYNRGHEECTKKFGGERLVNEHVWKIKNVVELH